MVMNRWKYIATRKAQSTRFNEIPKYVEGLYDLNNRLYAWMVPNGSWGETNAGLIVGDGESLLVDTLWDVRYTRFMLDAMRPLLDIAPLKFVVNTHADGDHFWGNQLVADADIIASKASYEELLNIRPGSMILLGRIGRLLSVLKVLGADKIGHWFENMVKPYNFQEIIHTPPTRTFEDEMSLMVGGRQVRLIQVGPAHTDGDVIVYVPESKTLYTGDILFIGSTPAMWSGPVENWLSALDIILSMDVDIIVPGHGPITDKDGVRQVEVYLKYINTHVCERYSAGMSPTDAAYDIVLSNEFAQQPFADWNSPERIMLNVHTMYRHLQGRTDHLKVPELSNIMRKQALLAHKLPNAQPTVMRMK